MPRIPETYTDLVFYLYDTVEAAENGSHTGGTGFFVHVHFEKSDQHLFRYAVTNRHVARGGASVLRINCFNGGVDIWDVGPESWVVHPDGDDLAMIHVSIGEEKHKVASLGTDMFVTERGLRDGDYGLGDAAFMIGRFIGHDGKETNLPAVSFGNISLPPTKMARADGFQQLSFGVEMRSMRGNSGSPVFTYTEPWDMETNSTRIGGQRLAFLGVDWGQVVHPVEVRERIVPTEEAGLRAGEREAKFITMNTGMNGVVPAWKLLELLNLPKFADARAAAEEKWWRDHPPGTAVEFN